MVPACILGLTKAKVTFNSLIHPSIHFYDKHQNIMKLRYFTVKWKTKKQKIKSKSQKGSARARKKGRNRSLCKWNWFTAKLYRSQVNWKNDFQVLWTKIENRFKEFHTHLTLKTTSKATKMGLLQGSIMWTGTTTMSFHIF